MAAWSALNNDNYGHSSLPTGNCNFADLTRSNDAPKCGCRRFWADTSKQVGFRSSSEHAWCFCGHHACFHDNVPQSDTVRQESRPSVPARSQYDADSVADVGSQKVLSQEDTIPWVRPSPTRNVGLGLRNTAAQPGIWDALNAYQRRHAGNESDGCSAIPSTATPSVPTSQAFNSSQAFMRQIMNMRSIGQTGQADINDAASATEINTPSIDGTPLLTRPSPNVMAQNTSPISMGPPYVGQAQPLFPQPRAQRHDSASALSPAPNVHSQRAAGPDDTQVSRGLANEPSLHELQHLVKSCSKRIDFLESLSYTHVPLEEVEDRFEQVDGRLISLEDFRDHVESRLPNQEEDEEGRPRKRRLLPAEATASFNSEDSLSQGSSRSSSSAVSATAAVYAEYNGRIETLQSRIEALESTLPTPDNPWRVEVVLLPWGRHLPGIWHSAESMVDMADRIDSRDEWNGAHSSAHGIFTEGSSNPSGWSTDSIQAWADSAKDWMCPKACGPNGIVYQRLWSRGLVQNIDIESADAFTFMQRCKSVFAHALSSPTTTPPASSSRLEYDALREPLVPLRKVKKVSRLRFLAPGEMVSSAIWTPAFLEASVFMIARGHQRRLYLTFPDAYYQQSGDGWTWQTIKNLRPVRQSSPRAGPGFDGPSKLDSEACWVHNPAYDTPRFVDQSFTSNTSNQSLWSTKSQASNRTIRQAVPIPSPMVSPVSEARTLRSPRRRTVSIPPNEDEPSTSALSRSKRRVASSFETSAYQSKKRRTSISSSQQRPRPGPAFTPRLSREPPSPFASDHPTDRASDSTSARRVVTPLAYETPHSHSNTNNGLMIGHGDGDTEADTDIAGQELWTGREDEWQSNQERETTRAPSYTQAGDFDRYKTYRHQEEDLDDEVDVGNTDEVLESLAQHMRDSYVVCRRHHARKCQRCPEVEHRYSLRSARGAY
ncbi:Hypothetical protein D9617_42g090230 [Elsinoe fawcettii]|nr:Hypothetical protein D9617_42g090230 [Elsinoe fawcettii]